MKKPTPETISAVMAYFGRRGGQSKSAAKAAAVRLNGAKGGRPKKKAAA